jgi:hypothetical protein
MNIDQRVQNSIYRTGSLCRTRLRLTCARSLTSIGVERILDIKRAFESVKEEIAIKTVTMKYFSIKTEFLALNSRNPI